MNDGADSDVKPYKYGPFVDVSDSADVLALNPAFFKSLFADITKDALYICFSEMNTPKIWSPT